jgi:hypothetical protein
MSGKQTYWIADPNTGAKASVEGAPERDRWVGVHGWALASEPQPGDRVWLRHDVTGGRQQFPVSAAPQWAGLGWHPGAPPEPVDLTKDARLVDQPSTESTKTSSGATPSEKPNTTSATAAGADKEK